MSEHQTLSLLNNDTENRNFVLSNEFREPSIKDDSLYNIDVNHTQDLQEQALDFLNTYTKIS